MWKPAMANSEPSPRHPSIRYSRLQQAWIQRIRFNSARELEILQSQQSRNQVLLFSCAPAQSRSASCADASDSGALQRREGPKPVLSKPPQVKWQFVRRQVIQN